MDAISTPGLHHIEIGKSKSKRVLKGYSASASPADTNGANNALLGASILSTGSRKSITLDYLPKKSRFASLKNGSPKTPVRVGKNVNRTILLESSIDTDVINASVEEIAPAFNWLRTPRSSNNKAAPYSRNRRLSVKEAAELPKKELSEGILPAPSSRAIYLEKSKQRNIEQWLARNVEPALALTPSPNPLCSENNSADIDPAFQEVLQDIYGPQWKDHQKAKCQTDVKRKRQSPRSGANTDVKRKKEESVNSRKGPRKLFADKLTSVNAKISPDILHKINSKTGSAKARRKIFPCGLATPIVLAKPLATSPGDQNSPRLIPLPSTTKKRKPRRTSLSSNESVAAKLTESPIIASGCNSVTSTPGVNLKRTPRRTFLASLSVSTPTSIVHPDAQFYKLNFAEKKDELIAKLFKLYNHEVFGSVLDPQMKITWNVKMRGTAGFCYNRRSVRGGGETRTSRIELSTRVVDRADRLRDTLLHEMCHAAAWITEGVADGHGAVWTSFTEIAHKRFPEIPPVSRRHNYEVAGKFTYRCLSCSYSINRQTKSIDLNRKRCGYCYGQFELLINKKKRGKTEIPEFDTTRTPRQANGFALFVKENYKKVKDAEKGKKHGEVMKILGQQYAIFKSVVTPGKK